MARIGFVGGGKMAEAIIKGLLASKIFSEPQITVSEIHPERQAYLKKTFAQIELVADNQKAAEAEVLILAVKPQTFPEVVGSLKLAPQQLVISIAAGITLAYLEAKFPQVPVVRVMPNNPALVMAGVTALAKGQQVTNDQLDLASKIFGSVGEVIMVEEKNMDAVTGLSGSGPAYVYLMIEALTAAGVKVGLKESAAEQLAIETVYGAAKTIKETKKPAAELRKMVTSPGGTTEEGLKALKNGKFVEAVVEAVKAAAARSKKLSQ